MAKSDTPPVSGTVLSHPIGTTPQGQAVMRTNRWWPGTYLLYQRGIECWRPEEEPTWLQSAIDGFGPGGVGPLAAYLDEATDELVPVLFVAIDPERD